MVLHSASDGKLVGNPEDHRDVLGMVVDVPANDKYVTLVALTDYTNSLYNSDGGGFMGWGRHPAVRAATEELLTQAQEHQAEFTGPETDDLPAPGFVRLHLLGPTERRSADVPSGCLLNSEPHALAPVLLGVQKVFAILEMAIQRGPT